MKSKLVFAVMAAMISATPAAYAAKAKAKATHHGVHKIHTAKGWKSCKDTYKYMKGGKCMDARAKKTA
jgi:hypothetical protein